MPEVVVYAAGSSGAATQVRTIQSVSNPLLGINGETFATPQSITVGPNGSLYVASSLGVTVFSSTANGYATPTNQFGAGLQTPLGVAVDTAGNVYVSNRTTGTQQDILIFAAGANGNAAPTRTITNTQTFWGLAVDSSQNIYVSFDSPTGSPEGAIAEFAAGASGAATPIKTITGVATGIYDALGLRMDSAGNLWIVNEPLGGFYSVEAFPSSASGNVAPTVNFSSANWAAGLAEIAVH